MNKVGGPTANWNWWRGGGEGSVHRKPKSENTCCVKQTISICSPFSKIRKHGNLRNYFSIFRLYTWVLFFRFSRVMEFFDPKWPLGSQGKPNQSSMQKINVTIWIIELNYLDDQRFKHYASFQGHTECCPFRPQLTPELPKRTKILQHVKNKRYHLHLSVKLPRCPKLQTPCVIFGQREFVDPFVLQSDPYGPKMGPNIETWEK